VRILNHIVWLLLGLACAGRDAPHSSNAGADDFGRPIPAHLAARRIVSLNPATTQLLFAMGYGRRVVGRTHWDLYPPDAAAVTDLGDGLNPNVEAILSVRPDLVMLYASQATRGAADRLMAAGVPTIALRTDHIADVPRAAEVIARVQGDTSNWRQLTDSIDRTVALVRAATAGLDHPRVFWIVWAAPLITVGRGSYFDELITTAGGRNIYGDLTAASPTVTMEDVLRRDPQVILASPDLARRIRSDPRWQLSTAVRQNRVLEPDTTLVGQPSVRVGEAAVHLANLLHPRVMGVEPRHAVAAGAQ
jgi:iron complex transport system substrate-binding protein